MVGEEEACCRPFSNQRAFLFLPTVRTNRSGVGLRKHFPHPPNGLDVGIWKAVTGTKLISNTIFQGDSSKHADALMLFFCSHPSLRCQDTHCALPGHCTNLTISCNLCKQGRAVCWGQSWAGTAGLGRSCWLLPSSQACIPGIPMRTAPCTAPAQPAPGCTATGSHHPLLGGRGPVQDVPCAVLLPCPELSSRRSAPGTAELASGTGILSIPRESSPAPSCLLPSSTASPQQPPTAVTNTPAARSVPHPPEPALCLLRPSHSPLSNSGSGTRFALPLAAADSGHPWTPPVPAEGTVAPDHFYLLSSALAGRCPWSHLEKKGSSHHAGAACTMQRRPGSHRAGEQGGNEN